MDTDKFLLLIKFYKLGLYETGYIVTGEYLDATNSPYGLIRKIYPKQMAEELCGIEPISGQIGQIFTLRMDNNNKC